MVLDLHIAQYVPGATSPSSNIHFNRNTFLWAWICFGFKIACDKYMPAVVLFTITGQHFRKNRVFVFHIRTCWWHSGGAHVSYHCDQGSTPDPCSYLIKTILVTSEKSVVKFVSTKHRRFSPGTPVSSNSNTEPMRGGPYCTSRQNSADGWQGYPV